MTTRHHHHHHSKKIEVLVSCNDLVNLDEFSPSDPLCVLFIKQFGQWKEYGRTEVIIDTPNPQFTTSFLLEYEPEANQQLLFSVYDIDSRSEHLTKHDFVGSIELPLTSLIQEGNKIETLSKSLHVPGQSQARGWINITSEFIVSNCRGKVALHMGGSKLDKKGIFSLSKTDVFLEVGRSISSVHFHPIYRSEVVHKSQDPRWHPFELSVSKLCNGDQNRPIRFSCWNKKCNGCELIGHAETTLKDIESHRGKLWKAMELREPKKALKKNYKNSGTLRILHCKMDLQHSLLDFINGGCHLKLMIAIDFTASNGDIGEASSLHNTDDLMNNEYVEAINIMGGMLLHHCRDDKIPLFGFGAKIKHSACPDRVHHCFPLNGDIENSEVKGIQGVIGAYRDVVHLLHFAGPSVFTPILSQAIKSSKNIILTQENQAYNILLIITDGVINDLDQAISAISNAASLPLSIIITGIGPADFTNMEQLSQNNGIFLKQYGNSSNMSRIGRRNFHFAALRKNKYSNGTNAVITKETMAAVSKQMVDYMKFKGINPNKANSHHHKPLLYNSWIESQEDAQNDLMMTVTQFSDLKPGVNRIKDSTGPTCPTCGASIDQDSTWSSRQNLSVLTGS